MPRIRKTGVVAICTALSRLLGFVRVSLIGFLFGASGQADVLNLVFQIPNNLRRLLAEGALSSAFIPILSGSLSERSAADPAHPADPSSAARPADPAPLSLNPDLRANPRARAFVQAILGFQVVLLIPLLLAATLFSPSFTAALFDFRLPAQMADATRLFRILIWYILPISVTAIYMAILNAHNNFTIPALSPLVSSAMVISLTLALHARIGIYAVAVGILVGGVAQLLMHIPHLARYRYRLVPALAFANADFRRALRNWLLIMASALLLFVNQQVAIYFASGLEVGSGSSMIYALTFWQLPFSILGVSVITVLFPKMSAQRARGEMTELRRTFRRGARYLAHVLLPATIFLLFCGGDIIYLALQRGQFTFADTLRTAAVLRAYSVGLLGVALFQYAQRFYYAIHKVSFTIKTLICVVALDIALSLWLKETRLRVSGLGWANSISFWVGAMVLYGGRHRIMSKLPADRADPSDRNVDGIDRADPSNAAQRIADRSDHANKRDGARQFLRLVACLLLSSIIPLAYAYFLPLADSTLPAAARLICLLACACLYGLSVLFLYDKLGVRPHPREFLFKRRR